MTVPEAQPRFNAEDLIAFARELFAAAGCDGDKPDAIARGLVEADLLGHTTHGLQLAASYLKELEQGHMVATGEPEVIADRGAVLTWDGKRLPGVWLVTRAVDEAVKRAGTHGQATVVIRQSHHIGCLAAFLERATQPGMMVIIASSDPAVAAVAPYGGRTAVLTPDPIAIGIPTSRDPVLIDISASISTNGMATRLHREGKRFPGPWAMDATGQATDDPSVLFADPAGTLLPTGGKDHGHKGYGLALMIEALTQGLGGFGRAMRPTQWGAAVFVQVYDPAAFGGSADFLRETDWLTSACRQALPVPGVESVRLPGERGLNHKRQALAGGLALYPGILEGLAPIARALGVPMPQPRNKLQE